MKSIAILMTSLTILTIQDLQADVLKIDLPEELMVSTPVDYWGDNLEKPTYKPRPDMIVPEGTTNLSKGKKVTSSAEKPEYGSFQMLVDGDKHYDKNSILGLAKGLQWVQIDLGQHSELYALTLWHFYENERVYFDVVIKVADDAAFTKNVRDVFNNDHDKSSKIGLGKDKEYIETYKSKLINLKKVIARYIRFYSNGNTDNNFNHYIETEVFGKPVK